MKPIFRHILAAAAILSSVAANADDKGRLFIIGNATPYGWDLDMAQALLSQSENPEIFSGTIYLKKGGENTFKFMEAHEWGSTEFGASSDADNAAVDGENQLASGTFDNGYKQMYVAQDGNYNISVDTKNLKADIKRSDYQDQEIKYCTLFLVGDATAGGWSVEDGTPLYQSEKTPYEYKSIVTLKSQGSFKIATALRGACSWDAKYYYFKDADDAGKISTDSTDDRQWSVSKDGEYTVTVNTISNTISIDEQTGSTTGIEDLTVSSDAAPVYYNLQGCKIDNPSNGIFIERTGNNVKKVIFN